MYINYMMDRLVHVQEFIDHLHNGAGYEATPVSYSRLETTRDDYRRNKPTRGKSNRSYSLLEASERRILRGARKPKNS